MEIGTLDGHRLGPNDRRFLAISFFSVRMISSEDSSQESPQLFGSPCGTTSQIARIPSGIPSSSTIGSSPQFYLHELDR